MHHEEIPPPLVRPLVRLGQPVQRRGVGDDLPAAAGVSHRRIGRRSGRFGRVRGRRRVALQHLKAAVGPLVG